MERSKIYIFTQDFFWLGKAKNFLKKIFGRNCRGPNAVFQSLIRGLTKLGIDFCVNLLPASPMDAACVLSGPKVLRHLIRQKQQGLVKTIIAGPNVVQTPNDFGGIIAEAEIDACLVPSGQVKTAYERYNPALEGRIFVWYTGVNEEFWQPTKSRLEKKNILLYCKSGPSSLIAETEAIAKSLNFGILRINYGAYHSREYRQALNESLLAIFFSQSESQGIALAEAWAIDVPTLVWNPRKVHPDFPDMTDSPAPYLSQDTGRFWQTPKELKELLEQIDQLLPVFRPREWVLENMTDEISAKLFMQLLNNIRQPNG